MFNHEKDKTAQTRYRERQRRKGRERICFWLDAELAKKAKKLAILQEERPGTIFAEIFAASLYQ
jgi:adenylosuccinate synthase